MTRLALLPLLFLACDSASTLDAEPAPDGVLDATAPDATPQIDGAPPDPGRDARPDRTLDALTPDAAADADLDAVPDAAVRDAAVPDAAPPDALRLPDVLPTESRCFDLLDNDGDGRADCADPDCRQAPACFGAPEACDNTVDDNGDDRIDCDDVLCLDEPVCPIDPELPAFTTEALQALFSDTCAPCHTGDGEIFGQLRLEPAFEEVVVGVPSSQIGMLRVAPGDRDGSYLWHKLRFGHHEVGGGGEGMPPPPQRPIVARDVERIGRWIDGLL